MCQRAGPQRASGLILAVHVSMGQGRRCLVAALARSHALGTCSVSIAAGPGHVMCHGCMQAGVWLCAVHGATYRCPWSPTLFPHRYTLLHGGILANSNMRCMRLSVRWGLWVGGPPPTCCCARASDYVDHMCTWFACGMCCTLHGCNSCTAQAACTCNVRYHTAGTTSCTVQQLH
jgi:hypothetical protein